MTGGTGFSTTTLGEGDRLGNFRLVAPLGEGAMGHVWRVEGPSGPAAIKLLSADVMGVRERFELEARALLKLRHPNVIRAVDYGHAPDGTPFIAMELLEGESLEDRLQRDNTMEIADALKMAHQAAIGLDAAHAIGIIHRDVKPGNIFLCNDGTVKVLDFGVAFWGGMDGRLPVSRLTAPGTVIGTPSYMAPEQAMGDRDEDVRTDVWGLGAVLYDTIAGRTPFDAGDSYLAELTRILTDPPDPLPPDVPEEVVEVIVRALTKERDERYATMMELADALREVQGVPSSAGARRRMDSGVMGALGDEVRLVSAVLVEGLSEEAQARFDALAREHGGRGSPLRGGAVAVFGGDLWMGDEAERAVRLALAVRGEAQRVGVGTGKAVQSLGGGLGGRGALTSEALEAAQHAFRIDDSTVRTLPPPPMSIDPERPAEPARPSQPKVRPSVVAVCPQTQRRIRGGFHLAGGRVIGVRPGGRTLEPREVGGREIPFVGRDAELDALIDVIDGADRNDRAAACVVCGPPGSGKSRLRFELLRWLADQDVDVRPFEGRGELGQGQTSFAVIREMLRGHAQLQEGTEPDAARDKIEALVASAGLTDETADKTAHFLGELLGVPFEGGPALSAAREDPRLMADGIRVACGSLFEGLCEKDLVLLMIEDGQWADAASLSLVDSLVEQLRDLPLAVVVTARPDFFVEHDALRDARRIELGELRDEHVAVIVEKVLGRRELGVVERAGGNPYLAEELSLAVREGQNPDDLPLTVEGAVLARLDKLAPDEKDLLKRAAVLGRRFWEEALVELGEPLAAELLPRLRRRELVVPKAESQLEGCREWRFRQAVVHEVCRGLLTDEQQRILHKAAASWLSRRGDAVAEEVAQHFEAARETKRALLWWLRAVHAARGRGDSRDALRHAGRVLDLAPTASLPAAEVFDMRLLRCEACYWLAEREALATEIVTAARIAERDADKLSPTALAKLGRWHAEHLLAAGLPQAPVATRDLIQLADRHHIHALQVQGRRILAEVLVDGGQLEEAARCAAEALDIAKRREGGLIRATAARAIGQVELRRLRLSSAMFYFGMARNLCIELGALREATLSGMGLAQALMISGAYDQAGRLLDKSLAAAQSLALRSVLPVVKAYRGWLAHRAGDDDLAKLFLDEAVTAATELGDDRLAVMARSYRAMASPSARQRPSRDVELALATARGPAELMLAHSAACLVEAQRGRHAGVIEHSDRALDAAVAAGGGQELEVELWLARREAFLARGASGAAAEALAEARACFEKVQGALEQPELRQAHASMAANVRLGALLEPS